ncbi:MAG: tyrosine-type recombinase/integrase [Clostridia bacterium]|nr:tyrosine-type recombinase/integrase [Clostridia bacterium]
MFFGFQLSLLFATPCLPAFRHGIYIRLSGCPSVAYKCYKAFFYKRFKEIASPAGIPDARFHDMRHSYAVAALKSGDNVKDVQEALSHATAAFTLDQYGHVTDEMKKESASRMEAYIKNIKKPVKGKLKGIIIKKTSGKS